MFCKSNILSWALTGMSALNYISEFPITIGVNQQKRKEIIKINSYTVYIKENCINDIKTFHF